jgi:beta-lactamase superfamily II metal-dependent hydrolase
MLPAKEGDALWIEYGDPKAPSRILIDCGYKSTYRTLMDRMDKDPNLAFELFVLTHIDGDHIAGAPPFIADRRVTPQRVQEVWFNGREMIDDTLGVRQAEYFTNTLDKKCFQWNSRFGGKAIFVPDDSLPAPIQLGGGMRITLLSPRKEQLATLLADWNSELDEILKGKTLEQMLQATPKALQPDVLGDAEVEQYAKTPFESDDTPPNGSSIAFLAEFEDEFDGNRLKRAIFSGDAFSPVIERSIKLFLAQSGAERLNIDALKLAHHGSKKNTSPQLLELLRCRHYLFSTDGSKHSHPDCETVARIITSEHRPIDLHFNYRSEINKNWNKPGLTGDYDYSAHYPDPECEGCVVII